MLPEHTHFFDQLCKRKDVVVVTGGAETQIQKQIPFPALRTYFMLSQQGNHAVHKDGTVLWHETVTPEQEEAVRAFADTLTNELALGVSHRDDLFENRGSQLAYSPIGFHERNEIKYAYDPDQSKRRKMLLDHEPALAHLRAIGIEAIPAGSTTIDFILSGKHKGYNITRFIAYTGWNKEDCLYIGDALFPGGNDETVIGVIPTRAVKNPDETFSFLASVLS